MTHLDFLNTNHPIRRTQAEKKAFADYILSLYPYAKIETTKNGKNQNIVIGNPLTAKAVCTAHYDTPARAAFPNIMIPRCRILFWLYQFVPVIVILAVSFAALFICKAAFDLEREMYFSVFLVVYYLLFYFMYFGFKNKHNHNDNTSGVAAVLSVFDSLTEEQRADYAFILFDNEEKGKKGSKAFFEDHKDEMKEKLILNFDCVGNGDNIVFVAMKGAEEKAEYSALRDSFTPANGFSVSFFPKKGSESNSDYKSFPCGIGCMACKKAKSGLLYTPYIHTARDTVASNENIAYITESMLRFVNAISKE